MYVWIIPKGRKKPINSKPKWKSLSALEKTKFQCLGSQTNTVTGDASWQEVPNSNRKPNIVHDQEPHTFQKTSNWETPKPQGKNIN